MKSKLDIFIVYATLIGFVSTIFMSWVFLNEAFFGRAVLFYEPNIAIAMLEFVMAIVGMIVLGVIMLAAFMTLTRPPTRTGEPAVSKSDRIYG